MTETSTKASDKSIGEEGREEERIRMKRQGKAFGLRLEKMNNVSNGLKFCQQTEGQKANSDHAFETSLLR
jgi:hypothetical protein